MAQMKELPFGYKMDDEACKLLVYYNGCTYEAKLEQEKLIYNRGNVAYPRWRLSGKGGKLYNAIIDNLKHEYLYGNSDAP